MKICPECYFEWEPEEDIGCGYILMNFCPSCGIELQDLDEFLANEKANDEDDAAEARELEDKND